MLAIILVAGAAQACSYAGLPSLARSTFKENPAGVFAVTTGLAVILLAGSPLTGALAGRFRLSRTFRISRVLASPSAFLMLLFTHRGLGGFAVVLLGGSIVLGLNMTLYNVVSTS